MNYQKVLEEIRDEVEPILKKGKIADYIPALKRVDPSHFAISLSLLDGRTFGIGDVDFKFSIQSISKVFTYSMAVSLFGEALHKRVGHEPSGNPFNSLVQLEYEKGIPRNPFINAGAIVITDMLNSKYKAKTFDKILDFIKSVSNNQNINYDKEVALSEAEFGYRNMALINMMKSFKNIKNNVDDIMDIYTKQCSISMSSRELSSAMLFLANHGIDTTTNTQYLTSSQAKRVNSLMLTCGHYDASGDFAFRVGLPGKSGVGGGIVAIVPEKMGICVWSPRLNLQGNSLAGTKALELFTTKTGLSIF